MRYRIALPTQESIAFWAFTWEFDKNSSRKIRCWGNESKDHPSVDIMLTETPDAIYDDHDRTVWLNGVGMVENTGSEKNG